MPAKSSIREVRINQNPFSAEYDRIGMGRVEVFTKPGSEDFHGEIQTHDGDSLFNSRNPFIPVKPTGSGSGWKGSWRADRKEDVVFRRFRGPPLHRKLVRQRPHTGRQLQVVQVSQGVLTPRRDTEENVRVDRGIEESHADRALRLRAGFHGQSGCDRLLTPSRIYNNRDSEDIAQFVETGVYGVHTVNETRPRYTRQRSRQEGNANLPTTVVLDAFTGGGPPLTLSFTNQDRLELLNTTTVTHGTHLLRWGGRLRGVYLKDQDTQNYTGTFTFSSLDSYGLTLSGQQSGFTSQQIRAMGGGASQFSLAGGDPLANVSQFDAGVFVLDDWRVRPNVTVSLGLRYEVQTRLSEIP